MESITAYSVQIAAADAANNGPTLSRNASFTTQATSDTTAPVITRGPVVVDVGDTAITLAWNTDEPADAAAPAFVTPPWVSCAVIAWETDKPADAVVNYGETVARTQQVTEPSRKNRQRITLTKLRPNTRYYVRVTVTDISGNAAVLDLQ